MQRGPDCYTGSYATAVLSASARSPVAKAPTNRPAPPPFSSIMARRRRWLAATGAAKLSAFDLPPMLRTGLTTLYSHCAGEFERWERAGIGVPPVFIVVCQNTAISKLVFEWIAGFERGDAEEGERAAFHAGHLELFRNYDDQGGRLPRPRTLLIDSRQIEAGDALDKGFREAAGAEIEQFKRELAAREGAGAAQGEASEAALLREVMNTVGRPGRLGEQIRCVVSVSAIAGTCRPKSSKPSSARTAGSKSRRPTSGPPRSSWRGSSAPASPSRPRCWSAC